MEIYPSGRLAYITKGIVKDCPYVDSEIQQLDLKRIAASEIPLAWFSFDIDEIGIEKLVEYKFNSIAVWHRVRNEALPKTVSEEVEKARLDPDFYGVRMDFWKEAEVYKLQYTWMDKQTGLKSYQHVLLGKDGGAVRWYEDD